MKATVFYKDGYGRGRRKTIEVLRNEPNEIVREFIKVTGLYRHTYVAHVKCGRYDYQWFGSARDAFAD